jgi:RES domain-containing protein
MFSGEGAYRYGGRWNSPGRAVIYMSQSLSLSALELLTHMVKMHMMRDYKCVWIDVPEELITSVESDILPADWRAIPAPQSTKQVGDQWFDSLSTPVLKVPSTVIPLEHNYVINPSHPKFNALTSGQIQDFEFDERLLS